MSKDFEEHPGIIEPGESTLMPPLKDGEEFIEAEVSDAPPVDPIGIIVEPGKEVMLPKAEVKSSIPQLNAGEIVKKEN